MSASAEVRERVAAQRWYHTIELAPGLVTDGWFDLRDHVGDYGLPDRMDGMRVLDVGTWDGFWAFEMERRGADVVALDVDHESEYDWPPRRRPAKFSAVPRGDGFRLAHEILGSRVERVHRNLYEATPEELGTFDLVFCGSVLIHLRDQLLALERLAGLCRGRLILAEEYDRLTSLLPFPAARYHADREKAVVFWLPGRRTWRRMVWTAGFDAVREHGRMTIRIPKPSSGTVGIRHVVIHACTKPVKPSGNARVRV
jgi:tRNA (mo5U34)-methyltransferase